MFRPRIRFDSVNVILQIFSFQLVFYSAFLLLVLIFDILMFVPFSSQQIVNFYCSSFTSIIGLISILTRSLSSILTGVAFSILEGRSRKAFDFMLTVQVIHFIVCLIFSGLPLSFNWWITTIISCSASIFTAEQISIKFELREINIENMFNL